MTRPVALSAEERLRMLAPPDPASGPVDVVIDADATNEVDDEWTVVWALLRPDRLRVAALYACPWSCGPHLLTEPGYLTPLDRARRGETLEAAAARLPVVSPAEGVQRAEEMLRRLVDLVGAAVPVVRGSDRYLQRPDEPVRSAAAEHLVALAHADREGPLYVLGLGCATTLASALLLDPTIATRVTYVWTSAHPTSWPRPTASFNLAQDVPAARVLLESGVPLVYLPGYQVGEELRVTPAEVREHALPTGRLGEFLTRLYLEHPRFGIDRPGASKVLWDLVCVAWLVDPSWLDTELVPAPSLDEGLRWVPGGPDRHLLREAFDVDRDAVVGDVFRVLREAGQRERSGA